MAQRKQNQKQNHKRLLRDIDGCVADFLAEVIRTWGEPQVPSAYSLEEMYPSVSDSEIFHFVQLPTTYMHLCPLPRAVYVDGFLRNEGWEIVNVTCRPAHVMPETADWLWDHSLLSPVQFVSKKAKINLLREGHFSAAVEDNLDLAREMAKVHQRVFLFDWPYNQGPCGNAIRIFEPHWNNVLKELCG